MLGCVLDSRQSVLDPRNTVNCLTYLKHKGCQKDLVDICGLFDDLRPYVQSHEDNYTRLRVFFTPC